jgi:hypothetical protein
MNAQESLSDVFSPYGGSFFTTTTVNCWEMSGGHLAKVRQSEIVPSKNLFYNKVIEQAKIIYNLRQQVARLKKMAHQKNSQKGPLYKDSPATQDALPQLSVQTMEEKTIVVDEQTTPKILIYGHSALAEDDIISIIKNKLLVSYNIELSDKDIKVMVSHQKTELKKVTPVDSLKSCNYDFFMAGPHPHSVKGKNIKHSWKTFVELKKIPTEVFESYHKEISKELLVEFASMIGDIWYENDLKQVA